jgi:hypothetical protein
MLTKHPLDRGHTPSWPSRPGRSSELEEKTWSWAPPEFLCPTGWMSVPMESDTGPVKGSETQITLPTCGFANRSAEACRRGSRLFEGRASLPTVKLGLRPESDALKSQDAGSDWPACSCSFATRSDEVRMRMTWSFASLRHPSIPHVSPPITDPIRTHFAVSKGFDHLALCRVAGSVPARGTILPVMREPSQRWTGRADAEHISQR